MLYMAHYFKLAPFLFLEITLIYCTEYSDLFIVVIISLFDRAFLYIKGYMKVIQEENTEKIPATTHIKMGL
jgi:hypothetical protein